MKYKIITGKKPCKRCGSLERYGVSYNCISCAKRKYAENPEARRAFGRAYRQANKLLVIYKKIKKRAQENGIPFNIDIEDIVVPETCPILGIPLAHAVDRACDTSPTVDRIIPKFGYVRGNIRVISHRANRIKNDGTAEEHEKIAAWIREQDNSHLLD